MSVNAAARGSTAPARPRRRLGGDTLPGRLVRNPAGLTGLVIVLGLFVVALAAPVIAPYDDAAQDISSRLQGPSADHLLGTDQLGRDLLSRLLHGTRIALGVAVPAVLVAMVLGLAVGLVAGYLGGRTDNVLLVVLDTLQSMPAVVLALILIALLGPSLQNVVVVIAAAYIPTYARVSRALVLSAKEHTYVEAERTLGAGDLRIVAVHILPNIVAPLFILLAMDIPYAITIEAGLSFLGLGVQPPTPSWGVILADGFDRVRDAPWAVLWAGLTLMVTTLGFTLLGESLRDLGDPRVAGLRRSRP
jgi:peptide/nickel transport system permease protein